MNISSVNGKTGSVIAVLVTALLGMVVAWWTALQDKGVSAAVKTEISTTSKEVKTEIATSHKEVLERFDRVENRVLGLENSKTVWTGTDMLRWSVHLKDSNPTLKVPEPEIRQ